MWCHTFCIYFFAFLNRFQFLTSNLKPVERGYRILFGFVYCILLSQHFWSTFNIISFNQTNSWYNWDKYEILIRILHNFLNRSINIIMDRGYNWNPTDRLVLSMNMSAKMYVTTILDKVGQNDVVHVSLSLFWREMCGCWRLSSWRVTWQRQRPD